MQTHKTARTIELVHRIGQGVAGYPAVLRVRDILSVERDENGRGTVVTLRPDAVPERMTGYRTVKVRETFERVADLIGGSEVEPDHEGDTTVYIVRELDEAGDLLDDIGHYFELAEARQVFAEWDGPCSLRQGYFRYFTADEMERREAPDGE